MLGCGQGYIYIYKGCLDVDRDIYIRDAWMWTGIYIYIYIRDAWMWTGIYIYI